ncbi:MAG: hypothetical protein Ct9H90mP5_06190 [Acidimicrobiaceae bacterium]|nr:MAG: hypothetical protein Ct9H90mP5_06190 [Acidimicrobiaceae bacterium]
MFVKKELNNRIGGVASVCDSTVFLQHIKKKGVPVVEFDGIPKEKN